MPLIKILITRHDLYTCYKCKTQGIGDKYTKSIEYPTLTNCIEALHEQDLNPNRMPIHWSSYRKNHKIVFKCPECNDYNKIWFDYHTKE